MNYENEYKAYVRVIVEHKEDGSMAPLAIVWEDGRRFAIDKVLRVEKRASRKAGGRGICYTCRIQNQLRYLYDEDGRWFIEIEKE